MSEHDANDAIEYLNSLPTGSAKIRAMTAEESAAKSEAMADELSIEVKIARILPMSLAIRIMAFGAWLMNHSMVIQVGAAGRWQFVKLGRVEIVEDE